MNTKKEHWGERNYDGSWKSLCGLKAKNIEQAISMNFKKSLLLHSQDSCSKCIDIIEMVRARKLRHAGYNYKKI